jgi:hypothetical protein
MKPILKRSLAAWMLAAASQSYAEQLGRLFFTAEQRVQLESKQSSNSLTINGIVQNNGGKRTVWINGVPQHDNSGSAADSMLVLIPGQTKPVAVKVGQKVHFNAAEK